MAALYRAEYRGFPFASPERPAARFEPEVSVSPANAPTVAHPDQTGTVDLDRLRQSLTRQGYAFVDDEDRPDALRARFEDYRFQFLLLNEGTVLQIRGRWSRCLDVARKVEMLKLCNEWNMSRVWPKVYVRRESEGLLGLYGEVTSDFSSGASHPQIDRAIECGLRTVIAFFHELEERLGAEVDDLDD